MLENRLDKAHMKCNEAQSIRRTYEHVRSCGACWLGVPVYPCLAGACIGSRVVLLCPFAFPVSFLSGL